MYKGIITVIIAISIIGCISFVNANTAFVGSSKELAQKAYFMLEESPFDNDVFESSVMLINNAAAKNKDEPWVYIALTEATLLNGYNYGNFFSRKSYSQGTIEKAQKYADKAIVLGGSESQSYANLARIYIIQKKYKKAWFELNKAYQLNNASFYTWYYKAVINYYMKDYTKAASHLDEAEPFRLHNYQKRFITRIRQKVARAVGNKKLEEAMYLRNINDFPESAYMYGNYGNFLLKNKRYNESIEYYKKAIQINPYNLAKRQLEKAIKLSNGS